MIFSVPAYHPFLGELHFRDALLVSERDDGKSARTSFAKAVGHLREIEETERGGGLWAAAVTRFVEPWGGLLSYRAAVCHVAADRQDEAEEALLHALLIDRRFAEQARTNPRLRALAEDLLAKRL